MPGTGLPGTGLPRAGLPRAEKIRAHEHTLTQRPVRTHRKECASSHRNYAAASNRPVTCAG